MIHLPGRLFIIKRELKRRTIERTRTVFFFFFPRGLQSNPDHERSNANHAIGYLRSSGIYSHTRSYVLFSSKNSPSEVKFGGK